MPTAYNDVIRPAAGRAKPGSTNMKWQRWIVVFSIVFGSMAAWGQATAEYGLAASKSAAATAATLDKLNRSSSAAIAAAGASASRATEENGRKTSSAAAAPSARQVQRQTQAHAKPPSQGKPAVVPETPSPIAQPASRNLPAKISLSRGAAAREGAPSTKYPGIVKLDSPAAPSEKSTAPSKPPQP
jgi:hypothetical protein